MGKPMIYGFRSREEFENAVKQIIVNYMEGRVVDRPEVTVPKELIDPERRYLVFAYSKYYPVGGWNDFIGAYSNLVDAHAALNTRVIEGWGNQGHIVDFETGEVVHKVNED